jgi:hypothetical protein
MTKDSARTWRARWLLGRRRFVHGVSNIQVWVGLVVVVGSYFPARALVDVPTLFEQTDAVLVSVCGAMAIAYAPDTWKALRLPVRRLAIGELMVIGIFVTCVATVGVFGGLWAWRVLGQPRWLVDDWGPGLARWTLAAGLGCALAVQWTRGGYVTLSAWARTWTLVAIAAVIAGVLSYFGGG